MNVLKTSARIAAVIGLFAVTPQASVADVAAGGCYEAGHVPALSPKTRIFATAQLELETEGADGRRIVTTIARPSILVAKAPIQGSSDLVFVPGEKGSTRLRTHPLVCAYPADAVLPAEFANRAPDIVIP
ncbi:MAG TPA: hypothetical protein VGX96_21250 [Candidatus Elarobacter sp.]|jgi:hypothetical protein|nr:hypothetical protein [Candidatus Elarobacter sp.]